jgi:transcriptional accessory protein Tex/SPT6
MRSREKTRALYLQKGVVRSKAIADKQEVGAKFKDYFDWSEPLAKIPSHRLLAIRRGEEEGVLMMRMLPPEEEALALLEPLFVKAAGKPAAEQVRLAVQDSYKRLLGPAIEVEMRLETKKKADAEAIRVFAENLRELLLAPRWEAKTFSQSIPGSAPGAKWFASIARENCSIMTLFTLRSLTTGCGKLPTPCARSAKNFRWKPLPLATELPAVKPKRSFARSSSRRRSLW